MVLTSLMSPLELYFIFQHLPFIFSLFLPVLFTKTLRAVIIHENMCLEINGEVSCSVLINCLKFSFSSLSQFMQSSNGRQVYIFSHSGKKEKAEEKRKRTGSQLVEKFKDVDILIAPLQPGWRESCPPAEFKGCSVVVISAFVFIPSRPVTPEQRRCVTGCTT